MLEAEHQYDLAGHGNECRGGGRAGQPREIENFNNDFVNRRFIIIAREAPEAVIINGGI